MSACVFAMVMTVCFPKNTRRTISGFLAALFLYLLDYSNTRIPVVFFTNRYRCIHSKMVLYPLLLLVYRYSGFVPQPDNTYEGDVSYYYQELVSEYPQVCMCT